MAEVSALMRAGGQFGGVDRAVLTFVLLFEFFDAHVRRGLVRLGRGRTVVLGSHTSRIDTRTLNLHGHPAAAGGVRPRGGPCVERQPASPEVPPLGELSLARGHEAAVSEGGPVAARRSSTLPQGRPPGR